MRIGKIGVVGAGAMGSGIAALAASAGFPVVLLDVPGETDRNAVAKAGVQRALKARPPQFMAPERSALIATGNTADDLMSLAACDWIIEAIIEQPAPKRQLFEQLERIVKANAIVSTNTSAIPVRTLVESRSDPFRDASARISSTLPGTCICSRSSRPSGPRPRSSPPSAPSASDSSAGNRRRATCRASSPTASGSMVSCARSATCGARPDDR